MSKSVLVLGAGGGIGSAIAKRFASEGYRVALQYKSSKDAVVALAGEFAKNTLAVPVYCDLSSPKSINEMYSEIKSCFGGINILVCSAGIADINLLTMQSEERIAEIINTNLLGAIFAARACVPHMVNNGYGRIINISSMWGQSGASCEAVYSASKGGIDSFTKALAKELGPSGITVNAVSPGLIGTKMNSRLDKETVASLIDETPLGRIGTPEDVANAVFFLASDEASFITGEILSVTGGMH